MSKTIITFFFSVIILASIVSPIITNLSEVNIERTEIVNYGDEEENKGNESIKNLEVKMYYSENNEPFDFSLQKKSSLRFYSQNYFLILNKLNSPPPEQKNLTT